MHGDIVGAMSKEGIGLSTLGDGPAATQAVRRLRLLDLAGHVVGDLAQPRSSVGQQPTNDVVLADPTVSRFHCEILLDDGAARIRDLESRNGTWVDGTRVTEAWLQDGAELRLSARPVQMARRRFLGLRQPVRGDLWQDRHGDVPRVQETGHL